jgi:hypothetical protein
MQTYLKINPKVAVDKWSQPLMEATGVKDANKLNWMSRLAEVKNMIDGPINESEKKLYESYGVSTPEGITGMGPSAWPSNPGSGVGAQQGAWHSASYVQGSGDIPTQIMGMAMNVAAYTVGFDLVTTIPVDMPTAIFQFLDSVYGGGNLDSAGKTPQYLSLSAAELTRAVLVTFVYGENIFIADANNADGMAIRGRFVGISQFSGKLLFKFESTGDMASEVYTPDAAGSEQSVATVLASFGSSASISRGSSATAADGTTTNLTSPVVDFVSSIREHIAGASNNDGITKGIGMTRDQAENGTDRKLQIKLWSKSTEMRAVEITADITRIQLRDLKAYGADGVAMLYKAAQNQLIQTINDEIVSRMSALGVKNAVQMYASQEVNLNLFIGPAGTANKALTAFPSQAKFLDPEGNNRASVFGNIPNAETNSSAENLYTRQRRIYSRILAGSSIIGNTSRYGEADVAIVNGQIGAALKDCNGFMAAPAENTIGKTGDLHFIGTAGTVKVYQNPKWTWDDTRVVMGRRGTEDDPGLKFLAYDLASSVEIIAPDTMAPKIAVLSRYDLIDAGFFPEASYITFMLATDFNSWI